MNENPQLPEGAWHCRSLEYEGFPLYLRWPWQLDVEGLSRRFPKLLVLTHTFNFRRFDGAPEPVYNNALADFDLAVSRSFSADTRGQIVLIETFAGKRNYYVYVEPALDGTAFCLKLRAQYPGHHLSETTRDDSSWSFYRKYHAEYLVVT